MSEFMIVLLLVTVFFGAAFTMKKSYNKRKSNSYVEIAQPDRLPCLTSFLQRQANANQQEQE